jgi:predicted DNA binding CopG/RHH family protein
MHDIEVKVRLTEADADLLKAIANREGLPRAVLARMLIKKELRQLGFHTTAREAVNGRPG